MIREFRHRPLGLLLPLLLLAAGTPIIINRCAISKAAARPASAPYQLPLMISPPPPRALLPASPDAPTSVAIDLKRIRLEGNRYVTDTLDGRRAELTLDPGIQRRAEEVLRRAGVAYGAAVFVSIPDGRILAMTGHSRTEPTRSVADLTLQPWAPAASVFKVITSAALLDARKINADLRVCYHGGSARLTRDNLQDRPRLDRRCGSLASAVGLSTNSIIAKLAHRYLDPASLGQYVKAFGFNAKLRATDAFPLEVPPSPAEVPVEELEFARTAAGFWHVFLSPLHGARIASAFANAGMMVGPRLIEQIRAADGSTFAPPSPSSVRVIPPDVAREVGRMMAGTTRFGTARGAFSGSKRRLPFEVAGKTGTLSRAHPYTHYNWFVGFAPADSPRVAFGVIVGTKGRGIRAAEVAREVLRETALKSSTPATVIARR